LNVACCAWATCNSNEDGNKCKDITIVTLTNNNKIIGMRILIVELSLGLNLGAIVTLDDRYIGLIEFHKKVIDEYMLKI
jgi:hypothetical protein